MITTFMKPLLIRRLMLACCCLSFNAWGASYEEYRSLLREHPSLQQLQQQIHYHQQKSEEAGGLPNPTVSIGVDNLGVEHPEFDRYLPTNKNISIMQSFPPRQSRQASVKQHEIESQVTKLTLDYEYQKLLAQLKSNLVSWQSLRELMAIAKQKQELIEQLKEFYQSQMEAGESVFAELSDVDFQFTSVAHELVKLQRQEQEIRTKLYWLLGEEAQLLSPPDEALKNEEVEINTLYPLQLAELKKRQSEAEIDKAKAGLSPQWGLSMTYKQREEGQNFDGEDWVGMKASVSMPLWNRSRQMASVSSAKYQRLAMGYQVENALREWQQKSINEHSSHDFLTQQLTLLKQQRASLQEIEKAAERNYVAGISPLSQWVGSKLRLLQLQEQTVKTALENQLLIIQFNQHWIGE